MSFLSSLSKKAPQPPESKGQKIYDDIDFSSGTNPKSACYLRNGDPNAVFVVNGASRGIGLQFVKSLLKHTKGTIVGCCRSPDGSIKLNSVIESMKAEEQRRILKVQLDMENQSSIEMAVKTIKHNFQRVDLLLNVAGILGDGKETPGPERSITKIDRDWFEKTLNVNLIGPTMFSKDLLPLMIQHRNNKKDGNDGRPPAIIVNMSARVGSISDNGLGGWYTYRISKAALNQATRTMAHELKRQSVWSIALHPGTTDTDLSRPFQKNVAEGKLFPVEFTVDCLLKVIDSMDEKNSGGLYDWAGKAIPF